MSVRAQLNLEIDQQGLEAKVTIAPFAQARPVDPDAVLDLLKGKGVKEGVLREEIERAFRTSLRKPGESVSFVAARGTPPRPAEPEQPAFEPLAIPPRLQTLAREVLDRAAQPVAYSLREQKVQKKKKVLKKPALPFLPAKETIETVWVRQVVREQAKIDPKIREVGLVRKGGLVAAMRPGKPGKEGRSIYGRPVPASRPVSAPLYLGEGLNRSAGEVRALATGFLRRGENWCDLVPFQDHELALAAAPDKRACFLSFSPGDPRVPLPTAEEIADQAVRLGVPRESLLPGQEIDALVREAAAKRTPLSKVALVPSNDALISVAVSKDRLRATLTLKKGRGAGRKLTLPEVSDALRRSGVRGFSLEAVKKDLLEFYQSDKRELLDYLLAEGQAPGRGEDGRLEWAVKFVKEEEARRLREASLAGQGRLGALKSLAEFPLSAVQAMAWVAAGEEVLRIIPASAGKPGFDVRGNELPGLRGAEPKLRIFEGLKHTKDGVAAASKGLLERGAHEETVLLRVRAHRDAEIQIDLSENRMQARLTYFPPEGTGKSYSPEALKLRLAEGQVARGVDQARLQELLLAIREGRPLKDLPIAEGRKPRPAAGRTIRFEVHLATGAAVTVRKDGQADYRAQDKLTSVRKGALLATLSAPEPGMDGWDVTGRVLQAGSTREQALEAGRGVRSVAQNDGRILFYAEADGELFYSNNLLEVKPVHTIPSDVDMSTGNVRFAGAVQVRGSVLSGFSVESDDDVLVEGAVQGASITSGGSIVIRQGVTGEDKALLRAKKGISALFVEQAELICTGDVRIRHACLRSRIVCNGRLILESDKGNLVGGKVNARGGIEAQNIGSPGGAPTELAFGQDSLLRDEAEQEERRLAALKARLPELETQVRLLERSGTDPKALARAREQHQTAQGQFEQIGRRLPALKEKLQEFHPAQVNVRGTLYPGVVLESHGKVWRTAVEKRRITLHYDREQRLITEKI
jgi:uncharacterized protein (DUF342 family)